MKSLIRLVKSKNLVEIGYMTIERDIATNTRKWSMYYYKDNQSFELEPGTNLIIPPQMFPEGTTIVIKVRRQYSKGDGIGI
jgi:hypothetical protein